MRDGIIYALIDPRTDAVRYVGQTICSLEKRRREHMNAPSNPDVRAWVDGLRVAQLEPQIRKIEHVCGDQLHIRETYWITEMQARGADLLNVVSTVKPRRPPTRRPHAPPPSTGTRCTLSRRIAEANLRRAYQNLEPLTYQSLSRMTGVPAHTLSGLARHQIRQIEYRTIAAICSALSCTPGDLLEYTPDPTPSE